MEALHGRAERRAARETACSTSPAARAISRGFSRAASATRASVVLTDINAAMLAIGRDRLVDEGVIIPVAQCNARAPAVRGATRSTA